MLDVVGQYVNSSVETLVFEIRRLIVERWASPSEELLESFANFDRSCSTPPAIIEYLLRKATIGSGQPVVTKPQLELLMLAMISRSSSTYGTIPAVVAHLSLVGEHEAAAILNENARNETGDRVNRPHSMLLFDAFEVLGKTFGVHFPKPASYHLARLIARVYRRERWNRVAEPLEVERLLANAGLHVPRHNEQDVLDALYFVEIGGTVLFDLHANVLLEESRFEETSSAEACRDPYDLCWLAIRLLELAMREASSMDEHSSGRLSYIGSWEVLVEALIDHVPPHARETLIAWTRAHNDEVCGQAAGWAGAAEEGHAEDARNQAIPILATLDAVSLAKALNAVARLNALRLSFWNDVVARLAFLQKQGESIPKGCQGAVGRRPGLPNAGAEADAQISQACACERHDVAWAGKKLAAG